MTRPEAAGIAKPSRGSSWALLAVAALAPAVLILALMTDAWGPLLLLGAAAALVVWSLVDIRAPFLVAVLLATFVDYSAGRLTLELGVVCAWLAWTFLLLLWRSRWTGWVRPPAGMTPGLIVWLGACALGVAVGLLHQNDLRSLGVELAGALWPALGLGVMQVHGRKNAVYAGLGLAAVGLIHVGFGLTMLQVYQHRIGGVYFTTVTGIVAVGLWTMALHAPTRRVRALCLLGMVPMLAHLLFSFTRGYWLGYLVGLTVATVLSWRSLGRFEPQARSRRLLLLPALVGVFVATVGLSVLYSGRSDLLTAIGGRFGSSFSTEVSGETYSNVVRLAEYERAIGAALESPVVGKGLGYTIVTRDFLTGSIREQWFVHNYYLLLWLKLGIVGLAAFGFLLAALARTARRVVEEDPSWLARAWGIAAIAVTGQVLAILVTNFSLSDVNTAFVLAYVWGVLWGMRPAAR